MHQAGPLRGLPGGVIELQYLHRKNLTTDEHGWYGFRKED
jgi:hypothetical protein